MTPPEQQSDTELFAARGFGRVMGYGSSPAIVSIDFINGFTDPSTAVGSNLDHEVLAARGVLDAGRDAAIPIIHTVVQYDQDDLAAARVWSLKQAGGKVLRTGTPAVEIDERIGRRPDEQILVKRYASAFFGTDLVSRLVSLGVDTVIIVGCSTSGCVRATAVDAVQHGFRPMIVREAVGDRSAKAHEQALFDLHQKYGDIVSAGDVREHLLG